MSETHPQTTREFLKNLEADGPHWKEIAIGLFDDFERERNEAGDAAKEIERLRNEVERLVLQVERLVLQVERAPAEARAIEADIERRKARGDL